MMQFLKSLLRLACISVLSACTAGPDYQRPDLLAGHQAGLPQQAVRTGIDVETSADNANYQANDEAVVQLLLPGLNLQNGWWKVFGSESLNQLITTALSNNADLQATNAALKVAQENAAVLRAGFLPSVDASWQPTRQKVADPLASPAASGASFYTLHTAQVSVSYNLDLAGGLKRQNEAAMAQVDAAGFQLQAARMTLVSNMILAVVQEAGLREQLQITQSQLLANRQLADLTRQQKALGVASAADVATQEAALAQAEASVVPVQRALDQQRGQLRVLLGLLPGDKLPVEFTLAQLQLPSQLPLSVPSELLERRPDIRIAEAQLQATNAQVGVAIAARLPNLSLTSSLGSSSLTLANLLKGNSSFWNLGANLTQPVFRGGALLHQQRSAEAQYQQAAAQYRSVVLNAFQNVADTLRALDVDRQQWQLNSKGQQASLRALEIARKQRAAGAIPLQTVLQAQLTEQQASLAFLQARLSRYVDTVAFYAAMGINVPESVSSTVSPFTQKEKK
ncbi:efflux transporter outer membrane subunit [Undibacterium rugosum]|uniref:efflux transporter outer membrane subunit n=1 Tax=Undibacterium rugosum TaxID=2762291 RepID=UPI001B82FA2F|nr:efflux transporter outer membrane subunit [Undibacterium rugosum]MBR7780406.1 efflux transporter outer membrane subunit [Undibacterium rugosum]